jgi:hypothetical protein
LRPEEIAVLAAIVQDSGAGGRDMKVKVFVDSSATRIETQINELLDSLSPGDVIRTETAVTAIAEKPNDGTYPCIVVTVWYDKRTN